MPRASVRLMLVLSLATAGLSAVPTVHAAGGFRAGVGIADATWHVGVGSGQYADKDPNALHLVTGGEVDPYNHSISQSHSYGVQSRLTYRALVVEGSNGHRVALVKSDSYLAQDMLSRRVAQILELGDSGITFPEIILSASHNHSSPYYFTPSWGVWLFQDAFEIRAFEFHARAMADAIERAADNLKPARMGGTTFRHTIYKGNIAGTTTANDGTPAGYPDQHADFGVSVLRFDDLSDPQHPAPLGVYVNHGQHPESLDGYDLITADYLGPLERFVERATGAPMIFSQGDVGSAEGPYFRDGYQVLPDGVVRAWAHVGHAQTERGARYLADGVIDAYERIGAGGPDVLVPMTETLDVEVQTAFIPGPVSHPYPSVSNCRSEPTVEGNPGSPIIGLPDCERAGTAGPDQMVWENLKEHGFPLPEHYDAPAFTGVEENLRLKLQAVKLGDVILASCSCEAQMDLILNLESRLDRIEGNGYAGYDWGDSCTREADLTYTCDDPFSNRVWNGISEDLFQRMCAQVENPADGWDDVEYAPFANAEPSETRSIKGNFSSFELPSELGYAMAIGLGHTGDYDGYTVSYREYMSRDHYRKALTSYGPHTADYMVSRLVAIAGELNGGPLREPEVHEAAAIADEARQVAVAAALGAASRAALDLWNGQLPSDIGPAAPLVQPANIQRFDAATFTWRGGSNAIDNPIASVQRLVNRRWQPFADQSGEVQTKVEFPEGVDAMTNTYSGNQEWRWTANFEAFSGFPATMGSTPTGTYRFVVDGVIRIASHNLPYHVTSQPFTVGVFEGQLDGVALDDGDIVFGTTTSYPRTYTSPFRYVADDGHPVLCKTCSFRPWASRGQIASALASITLAGGDEVVRTAALVDGAWRIEASDLSFLSATVAVTDQFGNRATATL